MARPEAGKRRWLYAAAGFLVLLMAGMVYAWSIISRSVHASYPDWTAAQLSATFTLTMCFFCLGAMAAGFLSRKIRPRVFVLIAGAAFLAGFLIAGSATAPALLYVGFGVLCGTGAGLAYTAVMGSICAWFPDRQGLISGILLMGFGLSSFLFGKLFAAVAPADGSDAWRSAFRIIGIGICVLMLLLSGLIKYPKPEEIEGFQSGKKTAREPAMEADTRRMMRTSSFWLYYVWAVLLSAAGLALVSQASGIAAEADPGISDSTAATMVGLLSIFNGIGRVLFGMLFDRKGYRTSIAADLVLYAAAGIAVLAALRRESFALLTAGFIIGGLAYGGVTPTNSALISDFFGRKNYAQNFSVINTNLLFASFSSTIAGQLFDRSGSYTSTILMMLILTAAALAVFLGIRRPAASKE